MILGLRITPDCITAPQITRGTVPYLRTAGREHPAGSYWSRNLEQHHQYLIKGSELSR
jgi:hypothetical protein